MLLLATGAAYANSGAPYPKKVIVKHFRIQMSLLQPPKYDIPYTGDLEIMFYTYKEDIKELCGISDYACAKVWPDHKKCIVRILTKDVLEKRGYAYNFALRHELAHCNGWKHPNTLGNKHFSLGQRWDEAEDGVWIEADRKMAAPKLPENTKILPAYSPYKIVCITPKWEEESCAKRQEDVLAYSRPPISTMPHITKDPCIDYRNANN
jgi:hypothetical protein